jgi:putative glutathione S-transferase
MGISGAADFPPAESRRYTLMAGRSNPRTHVLLITLNLLGLDTALDIELVEGWEKEPCLADGASGGTITVSGARLGNYFETQWKPFHKPGAPDLYPERLRKEIDALNETLYHEIDQAALDAGFAKTQAEYETAYDLFFSRLDDLEGRLGKSRYLFSERLTDSDIRLYTSLARFDGVYDRVFKCNRNRLIDFPNLWNYAKGLYQQPEFGGVTDFETIRGDYQFSPAGRNPYGLIALGPELSIWGKANNG